MKSIREAFPLQFVPSWKRLGGGLQAAGLTVGTTCQIAIRRVHKIISWFWLRRTTSDHHHPAAAAAAHTWWLMTCNNSFSKSTSYTYNYISHIPIGFWILRFCNKYEWTTTWRECNYICIAQICFLTCRTRFIGGMCACDVCTALRTNISILE